MMNSNQRLGFLPIFACLCQFVFAVTVHAQTGSWMQDRSKPTWPQILDTSGYLHPSPSEYNLENLGRFHLRGSVFHTPRSSHTLERVRFLLLVNFAGTNYSTLFKANSKVGVMVASELAFDNFAPARVAVPDIGKISSVPVSTSHVVTPSNPTVTIETTKVRITPNPAQLSDMFINGSTMLEVEMILPSSFRLPSDRDVRIIPFIEGWNSSAYRIDMMTLANHGATDSAWDQDASYFNVNMSGRPQSLTGYSSSNGFYQANRNYNGVASGGVTPPKTRLALGVFLRPLSYNVSLSGMSFVYTFSNAKCLFIQKTTSLAAGPWVDVQQIAANQTSYTHTIVPGSPNTFFRLQERDASNTMACLTIP
jgi:hypothetical protein